jgi:large subunit ribosomal protein L10
MSKQVKQMQMDALAKDFAGVKDMVLLSSLGVDVLTENAMRLALRKKNIRLQMVKNSLARRVFTTAGLNFSEETWVGSTVVAWGGDSVKGLSREIETYLKNDKLKGRLRVKTAVAEGAFVPFEQALKMPTRLEAIGEIVGAMMNAGGAIAGCLTGAASQLASQIQTISEKAPEGEPAATA